MKKLIKYTAALAILSLVSCSEDFLELEPQQSLSINSALTDIVSLNASVRGLYNNYQDANIYGWDLPLIPD